MNEKDLSRAIAELVRLKKSIASLAAELRSWRKRIQTSDSFTTIPPPE
jgi:hypothetical protein